MKVIKAMSFDEMVTHSIGKLQAKRDFFLQTGLCYHCEANPAQYPNGLDPYKCKGCNEKTMRILAELRGEV